jgi:hypothetical protein
MDNDMPEVSFVRMVLTAWGKNDAVVLQAPTMPIMSMLVILVICKYAYVQICILIWKQ